jgi:putative restriction endonuclease
VLGTIAVTDYGWYDFLRRRAPPEVNFWTPSSRRPVRASEFSPFFFKLKAPHNAICGFGYFARWTSLPAWLAWECFGVGNGCATLAEMEARIAAIRRRIGYVPDGPADHVGCVLIVEPAFFAPDEWVPQPTDWKARTVAGARYDLTAGEGARIWAACLERARTGPLLTGAAATLGDAPSYDDPLPDTPRYGDPRFHRPRLGQGTFRVAVTDAYERCCSVTGEHSLPVLEAAHIKSFAEEGPHEVRNGLLLRADLHRLFDKGYVTITPERRFEVSRRLKDDYQNGRSYYPLHGTAVRVPTDTRLHPDGEYLSWHNERVYRG